MAQSTQMQTHSDTTPQPTSDPSISGKSEPPLITAPITAHAIIDLSQTLSVDIAQCQKDDVTLRIVSEWLKDGRRPPAWAIKKGSAELKVYWRQFDRLHLQDGKVYRFACNKPKESPTLHVVIPSKAVPQVLQFLHGHSTVGHLGHKKTLARAREHFYWPYMARDIDNYCQQCVSCQSRSMPFSHRVAPLQTIHASHPFEKVAADITELPVSPSGQNMSSFSKTISPVCEFVPYEDQRAVTVAQCIFEQYVTEHGVPECLHTDQGRQFEADLIKELCSKLGVTKTRTSPYHPEGDGLIERFNRTLKDQLSKCLYQQTEPWDTMLRAIQLSYNTSVHSSTGYTPFFLVHGHEPDCHFIYSSLVLLNLPVPLPAPQQSMLHLSRGNCSMLSSSVRRIRNMLMSSKKLNMTKRPNIPHTMWETWFG